MVPPAEHSESTKEILLAAVACMVELLANLERLHPGTLDMVENYVSRETHRED